MSLTFQELKKEFVIQTLAKGDSVIVCDFSTMKMVQCDDLTISAINSYIAKSETLFFKGVVNE